MADKFQFTYADPILTESKWACATGSAGLHDKVPYGTYVNDLHFCSESVDVCQWTARRLGHPVMQLEFDSGSIYAMFEEAVSEYSQHINNYNIRNWMWSQYGNDTRLSGSEYVESTSQAGSTVSQSAVMGTGNFEPKVGNLGSAVVLSEQYGQAAGVGGSVTLHSASITLSDNKQTYDLQSAFSASHAETSLSGSVNERIVIQRVFNNMPSATTRFYDPYVGTYDQRMMLDQFGFGSYSPAVTFVLRPIFYDVQRSQQIETSDYIRKSNYSFEINNNQVRIFPIPTADDNGNKIWFEYFIRDDIASNTRDFTQGKVTDPSNVPHKFLTYSEINANGRQWIRKYTLALSKELLGIIRSKYSSMPLPNGEVTMDGEGLKSEGRDEKNALLEELKEFLDQVSLTEKAKAEAEEAEANQQVLNKSPLGIYLG